MAKQDLHIGEKAPDFELEDEAGEIIRLADFRGRKVIVYFYPKDDTPGCTTQACGFRDAYPRIAQRQAVVLGISPDGVESHRKFKSKHRLPFHLLVDPGHGTAKTYGVWGGLSNVRSHFVVDEHGLLEDIRIGISPEDSVRQAVHSLEADDPVES